MSENTIHPVILCGGSGTRLWPLSRKSYPKQFVPLAGEDTLFISSVKRLSGKGFAQPLVLTNADFRFIVTDQLEHAGAKPNAVLIEPEARNTAPAILAAALWLAKTDPMALMLVAPSDHMIPDAQKFRETVTVGIKAAREGRIVTFGISPDRPETGYGYLELAATDAANPIRDLLRFVEKPDLATAEQMLSGGRHLWNAGIFMFSAETLIRACETHCPELLEPVRQSVDAATRDLDFWRLAPEPWKDAPDISVDYAVMERAGNLSVVPFNGAWSDLGDWHSVWRESARDDQGNVADGSVVEIDCENSLLRSEGPNQQVVGIGLENIVVMAMPDAVLVADTNRAQDVKIAVERMKTDRVPQATQFPIDHRPWGWFESLATGNRFQVKRIVVNPGASLSLQSHHHRAEHWIVVEGTAKVTINDKEQLVSENQSVYIPLGAVHRMENPGKVDMVLIEVQTGSYLGEDDIIRYEDMYARD